MAEYRVEGLHCDGCAMSLKKAIKRQDTTILVEKVDAKTGIVTIGGDAGDLGPLIAAAATEVGFTYVGPA